MTTQELIALHIRQARGSEGAHYRRAASLNRLSGWLTLLTVVFTTVVGSSLFDTLSSKSDQTWKLLTAGLSLLAALMAASQKAFNLPQEAERNRVAGAGWEQILNELALASSLGTTDPAASQQKLASITDGITKLVGASPIIPERIFIEEGLKQVYDDLETKADPGWTRPPTQPRSWWSRLRG